MFLFRNHKNLSHKQSSVIGFVLAIMSLLTTAVVVGIFPLLGIWLNSYGIYHLDLFLLAFLVVFFLSVQALILFGFPLFYAQDKKSHMTGFQILVYALVWMLAIVLLLVIITVAVSSGGSAVPLDSITSGM